MEAWYHSVGVAMILVLTTWMFLKYTWFEPKKMEKSLRAQGLNGSSYRFLFGDLKEMSHMTHQAKSKPMDLKDDIVPRVSPFYLKSVAAFGKIFFMWMGPKPMVHIAEPEMMREILSNYLVFQKSRGGNSLMRMLMKGLLDTEAQQWVKHRKIISPAFHVDKLKYMVPAFYVSCDEMIKKWGAMLIKEHSCEVDVWPYLQTMTNDVISRAVFGNSFEEGRKIFDLQQQLIELILKSAQSMYIPGLRFLPTKSQRKIKDIDRQLKCEVKSIIDTRVAAMKAGDNSNHDLLGFLLNSNYQEIKQDRSRNSGLTTEEIIEECKLFFLAGQETTLNLLVWTMVMLSQHTNWQIRARNEVLQVFGDNEPDFEGLSHLKVVNMIFNEVLRLYPPAINIERKVHKETKLGDIMLAPGTLLKLNILLLHHDREIWGNDVKEFKPERFSEGVSKATNGKLCYLPFGGGPRSCIGQNFAILQSKMVLVMILRQFSFELSPSYSHTPHVVLTLQPQLGAYLILHKH
uniref:cytochrome P450 CYP72A219-like n=1 Tax=Erigeron canadensis TaxID=72917 RepID=UPI001CB91B94|nr:cytochrome P450 CYP72A219-like [Erigeron canadensis]